VEFTQRRLPVGILSVPWEGCTF